MCVAVPSDKKEEIKGSFMKKMKEAADGWADKEYLLDTVYKKGNMTQVLIYNFPYIHVDFEGNGGMMKIIKTPQKFPSDFIGVSLQEFIEKLDYSKR